MIMIMIIMIIIIIIIIIIIVIIIIIIIHQAREVFRRPLSSSVLNFNTEFGSARLNIKKLWNFYCLLSVELVFIFIRWRRLSGI